MKFVVKRWQKYNLIQCCFADITFNEADAN